MKKLLYSLSLLFILSSFAFCFYDDFTGYEKYYKVLDAGTSLTPLTTAATWTVTASTAATNLALGLGSGTTAISSIQFDKNNTYPLAEIHGNSIYKTDLTALTSINSGYCTMFLRALTIKAGGYITDVDFSLTNSTNVTNSGANFTNITGSTSFTISTGTTEFTYRKVLLVNNALLDYSNIQSARFTCTTDASTTTVNGVQFEDVRYISKDNNTTGGTWNEASGIWEIFKASAGSVYCQLSTNGSGVPTVPQLLTKTDYKDFIFSAKFNILKDVSTETGLLFRDYLNKNYRFVVNSGASSDNNAVLKLKKDGTELSVVTIACNDFDADTTCVTNLTGNSFWLKAEVKGANIKGYYATKAAPTTWIPVIDYTDPNPILYGKIGVVSDKRIAISAVTVLPIPANLSANGGDGKVQLVWNNDFTYSGEIIAYNIYKSTTPGVYGLVPYASKNGFLFEDTSVTNGTTYYYKVTAVIQAGTNQPEVPLSLASEISATPHPGVQIENNTFMPNSSSSTVSRVKFTVYNPTATSSVVLKIYQPSGVLVKTINGTGINIFWDGTNASGGITEGGIYIWQITVDNIVAGSGTIVLAK